MGFYNSPEFGTYHLNEAKAPRIVPGNERHKWDRKPHYGESATCIKCGCVKHIPRGYVDPETYQMPGEEKVTTRPACTGKKP